MDLIARVRRFVCDQVGMGYTAAYYSIHLGGGCVLKGGMCVYRPFVKCGLRQGIRAAFTFLLLCFVFFFVRFLRGFGSFNSRGFIFRYSLCGMLHD